MFISFDAPGQDVIAFLTYRSFAYFRWCQFVVGGRKMKYSLTFYFDDLLLAFNVSCYICLSCGTECRGLKGPMKTTKTGVQRIKMNSVYGLKRKLVNLPLSLKYSS